MFKQFMVVTMPKNGSQYLQTHTGLTEDYDAAFESFNQAVAQDREQLFNRPKIAKPLRAVLSDAVVELWVINRTDELVKA